MRRLTLLLLALFIASTPLARGALEVPAPSVDPAQPHRSSDEVKKALSAVIEAQLAAFRAEDYAKAYTFAAAEIQGMFNRDQFEQMVKTGYPLIAHSTTAEFGLAIDSGDEAVVSVKVSNGEKKSVTYQYHLVKQKGAWRIGGVTEVQASGGGVTV
jgi:ABC-type transporter MlaC component